MTNKEFLKSVGFVEIDGWLCNPYLDNEAIFHDAEMLEKRSLSEIIQIITVTSFNAGSRYERRQAILQTVEELEKFTKKLKKNL